MKYVAGLLTSHVCTLPGIVNDLSVHRHTSFSDITARVEQELTKARRLSLLIILSQVSFIFLASEVQNHPDLALLLEDWVGMEDQVDIFRFTFGLLPIVI